MSSLNEIDNYFANGWINNLAVTKSNGKPNYYLFTATVKHFQSLLSPPLKLWIAVKANGTILYGHCNCMAGAGEACSHLAFAAEANTHVKE